MPGLYAGNFQFAFLLASVAGTGMACGLLALECYGSRKIARRAPGVLVAALFVFAAYALTTSKPLALAAAGLALLLLLVWPIHFEQVRAQIARFVTPKVIWTGVLVVCLVASRYLATNVLNSLSVAGPAVVLDLSDVPVVATEAVTDKGRPVPLFHFKVHGTVDEVQQFIQGNERDRAQLIRLGEANPASNCHGWVFTHGQYGVRDGDIDSILSDHDYVQVESPEAGDLAIYVTGENQICHSGIVRIVEKHAPILVESKWGPFGVYLHAVEAQPFSRMCKFYRTRRASHELALRPIPGAAMAAQSVRTAAPR